MDRLSALDSEFVATEDGVVHMHIAGVCVFDGPPARFDDALALLESKLHLMPRYRQRVRSVPLGLGWPVWADDPHFDPRYHLRHTALPAPGDDADLCRLIGRLMSQPLDRARPLWETWLVEGLEGGRWAFVCKVHHAMVDGIAGVQLLEALLDLTPSTTIDAPVPWQPRPEPPGAVKVLDAWAGLGADSLRLLGRRFRAAVRPTEAARDVLADAEGLARLASHLVPARPISIEGPIGPHRAWAHSSVSLSDVKAVREVFGGTVNDVALAAVAGGYRELLASRGDDLDRAVVRALIPVSTRGSGRERTGNRVTAMLLELPVSCADPVERLALVREQMARTKESHMAEAGGAVISAADLAPPMIAGAATRLGMRSMRRLGQYSVHTVVTNVPGPQIPLYCLGHEMLEYIPFVPIFHGVRVGTAVLSYNGRLSIGVTGDYTTAPDVGVLAHAAARGVEDLRARADGSSGREPGDLFIRTQSPQPGT